ncbi:Exodeoxyribonuclease VII large subunit [Lachnospiraceae bacterium TWA4]|nr:Exodeoxyribonuclease VII large subunit [Lachnospiraceae bacterium TWA4]
MGMSVYSVSQVNSYIKNLFEQDFALRKIYVKGEVSNCKYHSSGHVYFTLKDEGGVLASVLFKSYREGLSFRLTEGMNVIVLGSIRIYERDGKYQLYATKIILDGIGELYVRYEQLKQELEDMGMFAPEYKRPIPKYAKKIGIVTAPTGAAIRDIINISKRRNPYVKLFLYPALVQGEQASASICEGIRTLDQMGLDCLIVGRGGGSLEDLWAFNEEETAYAIFHSKTPIISAVGHETDVTIADFVADLRAPTPSAAAELAVFDYALFDRQLAGYRQLLIQYEQTILENYQNRLTAYQLTLQAKSPKSQLQNYKMQLDTKQTKLQNLMSKKLESYNHELQMLASRLDLVSPLKRLGGGYAFIEKEGKAIDSVKRLKSGDVVDVYLSDGKVKAEVIGEETNNDH